MSTLFEIGDIIVYDSRASYGPSVELTGIVLKRFMGDVDFLWKYQIQWYKAGKFDSISTINEKSAEMMSFPRIGNVYPFKDGDPSLIAYTDADQYKIKRFND